MSRIEHDLRAQLSKIPEGRRTEIESHLALFRNFDTDGDGKLSHEEFSKLLFEINSRPVSGTYLPSKANPSGVYIRKVDLSTFPDCDEDQFISVLEFLSFIRGDVSTL